MRGIWKSGGREHERERERGKGKRQTEGERGTGEKTERGRGERERESGGVKSHSCYGYGEVAPWTKARSECSFRKAPLTVGLLMNI